MLGAGDQIEVVYSGRPNTLRHYAGSEGTIQKVRIDDSPFKDEADVILDRYPEKVITFFMDELRPNLPGRPEDF